jgi:serine/threonine protein kinase
VPTQGQIIGNGYELPSFDMDVPRENITLGEKLGEGNFGCVYQAQVKNLLATGVTSIVAVKMLQEGYTVKDMMDLLQEVAVMQKIGKHDNIVNLLGCCTANGEMMVIVECALNGSLKKFLQSFHQIDDNESLLQKSSQEIFKIVVILVNFSWQVACGMEYLASKKCVHRDLAARNILIDLDHTLKICDFGLARGVNAADYYRQLHPSAVPFRLMAPESLAVRRYDSQSDVYVGNSPNYFYLITIYSFILLVGLMASFCGRCLH